MNKKCTNLSLITGLVFALVLPVQAAELTREELQTIGQLLEGTVQKDSAVATAGQDAVKKETDVKEKKEETALEIYYRISVSSNEDMQLKTPPLTDHQISELARRIRVLPNSNLAAQGDKQ